jgi:putative membrane protein
LQNCEYRVAIGTGAVQVGVDFWHPADNQEDRVMKPTRSVVGAFAVMCVLAAPLVGAQSDAGGSQPPAKSKAPAAGQTEGKLAPADSKFVHEAAIGGMAEVELGKLATDKASSPDVKQFGQRMVDDHSKANDELKTLASSKGVTLPDALDPAHKSTQDRLAKLSGEAFDRAYMRDMVADHDKDVAAFKHASTSLADADLKAWAGNTLPTLEEHQKSAKSINSKLAAGTTGKK